MQEQRQEMMKNVTVELSFGGLAASGCGYMGRRKDASSKRNRITKGKMLNMGILTPSEIKIDKMLIYSCKMIINNPSHLT